MSMTSGHSAKWKLLICAASSVLASQAAAQEAAAQEATESSTTADAATDVDARSGIADIVVTARKREEALQDVPLAIAAYSGETLANKNVQNLRSLSTLTAGLVISDLGAEAQSSPIIRGISQTNILRNGENNVSSFVDGVYIFNLNAINVSVLDLERIEVVKGPVSALYGRNSFAGAINYITAKPSLSGVRGRFEGTLGTAGKRRAVGAVSVPLVEGALGIRVAGAYDTYDGTYEDQVNGNKLGDYEKKGVQFSLLGRPSETIEVSGALYYGKDLLGQAPASYLTNNCSPNAAGTFRKFCGRIPNGSGLLPPEAVTATAVDFAGNDREVLHGNFHLDFDWDVMSLALVTGYNDVKSRYFSEFNKRRNGFAYTLSPGPGTYTANTFFGRETNTKDFSQEVRLASPGAQRLRWQVGAFYYKLKIDTSTIVALDATRVPAGQNLVGAALLFSTPTGEPNRGQGKGRTRQMSAFAVIDFDITEQLTFSSEGRYTDEKKFFNQLSSATRAPDIDGNGRSQSFNFVDARFTLTYKPSEDFRLYASAAKGTKAGGFNDSATVAVDFTYEPEKNWTYELGFKSELLDKRAILNGSLFYVDWTGVQLQRPSSDPNNPAVQVGNIGKAIAKGFELESSLRATDAVSLRAAVSYSDVNFGEGAFDISSAADCAAIPSCVSRLITVGTARATNLDGLALPRQRKWNITAGFDIEEDLVGDWRWFAGADYAYLSKQYFENSNFAFWGPRNTLNARVGVTRGGLRLTAWVDNLLNDSSPVNGESNVRLTDFVFETLPILPEKRTWGFTAMHRF